MRFTANWRKSEKWLLNYARNANNPIPVASVFTPAKNLNAPAITVNEGAQPGNEPSKDEED
jgi:hypothetical protein